MDLVARVIFRKNDWLLISEHGASPGPQPITTSILHHEIPTSKVLYLTWQNADL